MTMPPSPPSARPLIVRLRNWVGEVILGLPTLVQLAQAGYEPHLVGKTWASDLLAGYGWPVYAHPNGLLAAAAQLRGLKRQLRAQDPAFTSRLNTLLLTHSLSSALEARLAGLNACGAALDGRGPLLARAVRLQSGLHVEDEYWRVGAALSGIGTEPTAVTLPTTTDQDARAQAVRDNCHLDARHAVLCPFSGSGDTGGKRRWPEFSALIAWLRANAITPVICPGSGAESAQARRDYPDAIVVESLPLGAYAALMRGAWCVIANDTGPGHIAASAGAQLVSIYGPGSFGATWMPPRGPRVQLLLNAVRWPTLEEVVARLPPPPG